MKTKARRKGWHFESDRAVRAWLRDSDAGRAIMNEVSKEIREEIELASRGKGRCLVVLHSDGWVETYADKSVDVCMAAMPNTERGEAMLDGLLPLTYTDLFIPINHRKSRQIESITAGDMLDRLARQDLLAVMQGNEMARLTGKLIGVIT